MTTAVHPDLEITHAHLDWARRLISEVRFAQSCEEILAQLIYISQVINQAGDMAAEIPGGISPKIVEAHKTCLEQLQESNQRLLTLLEANGGEKELATRARTFGAFLTHYWDSWHADVAPETLEALTQKIFHGAA